MAESETSPPAPPNLRASADESKECGTCVHYQRGHCDKYPPLCVDDEWVCDAWAKNATGKDVDADASEDAKEPAAKNVRQAEQIARGRFARAASRQETSGKPGT